MRNIHLYQEIAIREAKKSMMEHKYGAILISKEGKILNVGYNTYTCAYTSRLKDKKTTWHAEMNACKKIPRNQFKGATMIIVRLEEDKIIDCNPCHVCKKMICSLGISKIYLSRCNLEPKNCRANACMSHSFDRVGQFGPFNNNLP